MRRGRMLVVAGFLLLFVCVSIWLIWPRNDTPLGYSSLTNGMTPEEVRTALHRKPFIETDDREAYCYDTEPGPSYVHVSYKNGQMVGKKFIGPDQEPSIWQQVEDWLTIRRSPPIILPAGATNPQGN